MMVKSDHVMRKVHILSDEHAVLARQVHVEFVQPTWLCAHSARFDRHAALNASTASTSSCVSKSLVVLKSCNKR